MSHHDLRSLPVITSSKPAGLGYVTIERSGIDAQTCHSSASAPDEKVVQVYTSVISSARMPRLLWSSRESLSVYRPLRNFQEHTSLPVSHW